MCALHLCLTTRIRHLVEMPFVTSGPVLCGPFPADVANCVEVGAVGQCEELVCSVIGGEQVIDPRRLLLSDIT